MHVMELAKPRVAILTFTDAREEGISSEAVERFLRAKQEELGRFLAQEGAEVIDPLRVLRPKDSKWYGLRSLKDIDNIVGGLSGQKIDAVIVGAWTWSPPMFIKEFIRKFPKPLLYYTENDPMSGNLSQLAATCSSLMDWSVNEFARKHERNFGDRREMLRWLRGVTAVSRMRESALMLWGGSYAVKMDQLQDDFTKLKSFMIRDVLLEDQYILVNRAEHIRSGQPQRIRAFLEWIQAMGLRITYDPKMVTTEALKKQAALLLAARDRLAELADENIRGVSIKCQPEIYSEYGVNACMLPAFLPLAENELGPQAVYPTVCEGDTKGLLTGVLLHALNPAVPPAFGDLVSVGDDHIEFANCGAGSLFWAANSLKSREALSRVEAVANIHGNSGAAFNYFGVEEVAVTVARLTRIDGLYYMQLGAGKELDARRFLQERLGDKEPGHLGGTWGKVVVDLGVKAERFVKVIGANHLHATLGDVTAEIEAACRLWGIRTVRLDRDADMARFYDEVRR
jgi:L-fucose isomerase